MLHEGFKWYSLTSYKHFNGNKICVYLTTTLYWIHQTCSHIITDSHTETVNEVKSWFLK